MGNGCARIAFSRPGSRVAGTRPSCGPSKPETGPWLLFALLKRDATDLVVRQAVELGASRILPVITERTNAARVNDHRLRAIAIEAAEQSERLTIPPVDQPRPLDAVLSDWPLDRRLFVALERSWPMEPDRSAHLEPRPDRHRIRRRMPRRATARPRCWSARKADSRAGSSEMLRRLHVCHADFTRPVRASGGDRGGRRPGPVARHGVGRVRYAAST